MLGQVFLIALLMLHHGISSCRMLCCQSHRICRITAKADPGRPDVKQLHMEVHGEELPAQPAGIRIQQHHIDKTFNLSYESLALPPADPCMLSSDPLASILRIPIHR